MADASNASGLRSYLEAVQPSLFGMSKTDKRRKEFYEISEANLAIVDELIAEMRRLLKNGQTKEYKKLADVTQKILDNNAKFQAVVGEVLSDTK